MGRDRGAAHNPVGPRCHKRIPTQSDRSQNSPGTTMSGTHHDLWLAIGTDTSDHGIASTTSSTTTNAPASMWQDTYR